MAAVSVRVQTVPFDPAAEAALLACPPRAGAVVTFTGLRPAAKGTDEAVRDRWRR